MVVTGTTLIPHDSILPSDRSWLIGFGSMSLYTHQLLLPRLMMIEVVQPLVHKVG